MNFANSFLVVTVCDFLWTLAKTEVLSLQCSIKKDYEFMAVL